MGHGIWGVAMLKRKRGDHIRMQWQVRWRLLKRNSTIEFIQQDSLKMTLLSTFE